jgi:hypothetical protein
MEYATNGKVPPEIFKKIGLLEVRPFDDLKKLEQWQDNLKGIGWSDQQGNTLFGALDNVLIINNKLTVLDYKTRGFL